MCTRECALVGNHMQRPETEEVKLIESHVKNYARLPLDKPEAYALLSFVRVRTGILQRVECCSNDECECEPCASDSDMHCSAALAHLTVLSVRVYEI